MWQGLMWLFGLEQDALKTGGGGGGVRASPLNVTLHSLTEG